MAIVFVTPHAYARGKVISVHAGCNRDFVRFLISKVMTLDHCFVISHSLYGNNIDDAGTQALAKRLPHCTNPQNLK